jgi:hypothetical protein
LPLLHLHTSWAVSESSYELISVKMTDNSEKAVAQDITPAIIRDDKTTEIKAVQNVALADATAKQKPSLWTRRMFQVSLIAPR